jgi:hypothetical protein
MTAKKHAHRSHNPKKAERSGDAGGVDGPAKPPAAGFEPTADGVTAEDVRVNA